MGSNGLRPALNDKCSEAPTKAKYLSSDAAWTAANKRSVETGLDIVAYACPGCGYFHLTKKVTGSDVVVKAGVGITTGALRKKNELGMTFEYPERANVTPIVPGNREARKKALAEFLKGRDTVMGSEVMVVLGIRSTSGVGPYMREQGWEVSSHGRGAYWARENQSVVQIRPVKTVEMKPLDQAIARHPSSQNAGWTDLDWEQIGSMSVDTLIVAYRAAGMELRLQVRKP